MDAHSHKSAYALNLCKCSLDTCAYCSSHPVCMPLVEFNSLCYLPLPILDASGQHFKAFKEVYGQLQVKKIDHPWGTQRMRTTMNLTKLIAKFFFRLEESEQQWVLDIVLSPDGCFLYQYWVRRWRTCCVNLKAVIPVEVSCFHQLHHTIHSLPPEQIYLVVTVLRLSTTVQPWSSSSRFVHTVIYQRRYL